MTVEEIFFLSFWIINNGQDSPLHAFSIQFNLQSTNHFISYWFYKVMLWLNRSYLAHWNILTFRTDYYYPGEWALNKTWNVFEKKIVFNQTQVRFIRLHIQPSAAYINCFSSTWLWHSNFYQCWFHTPGNFHHIQIA